MSHSAENESKKIRAVIFDLGNTLIYYEARDKWPEKESKCIALVYSHLASHESVIDGTDKEFFTSAFQSAIQKAEKQKKRTLREVPIEHIFSEGLSTLKLKTKLSMAPLLDKFYLPIYRDEKLLDGVSETLERIKSAGFSIGLVSNAALGFPSRYYIDDMKRFGIYDYFDALVFSSDIGYVKPHANAFKTALAKLNVSPNEALFIGDNPITDVVGAQLLGMKTVLKQPPYLPCGEVSPDHKIHEIREVLDVLGV